MKQRLVSTLAFLVIGILLNTGCTHESKKTEAQSPLASTPAATAPKNAVATLEPAKGSKVTGTVVFSQMDNALKVTTNLQGLKPNSKHGFHIHQYGDCRDPKFQSAGPHWNPTGMTHGGPGAAAHHMGDLGNISADAKGRAQSEHVFENLNTPNPSVGSMSMAFIGRAVIVHEQADDLKTDPSGNSGNRIACGVIGLAQ